MRDGLPRPARTFLLCGGLYYLFMVVAAVSEIPELWIRSDDLRLPFLKDLNAAYLFLVSFPVVAQFLLSDDALLGTALREMEQSGALRVEVAKAEVLTARWNSRFWQVNRWGQWLSAVVAVAVACGNLIAYGRPESGFWLLVDTRVSVAGWMFVCGVGVFYAVVALYVLRAFAITWFLHDLVRVAHLKILPFHPDNCGGLRPVGRIALRSQYSLSVLGVNLAVLVWLSVRYLGAEPGVVALVLLAVAAYLVLGPIVFLAPLLPFRSGMLESRSAMLTMVARQADREVERLTTALQQETVQQYDSEPLERLHRLGRLFADQPVWPFDISTQRKFLTAYIVPVLGLGLAKLAEMALEGVIVSTIVPP